MADGPARAALEDPVDCIRCSVERLCPENAEVIRKQIVRASARLRAAGDERDWTRLAVDHLLQKALAEPNCCKAVADVVSRVPFRGAFFDACWAKFHDSKRLLPTVAAASGPRPLTECQRARCKDMLTYAKLIGHSPDEYLRQTFIMGTLRDLLDAEPSGAVPEILVECTCETVKINGCKMVSDILQRVDKMDVFRRFIACLEGLTQRRDERGLALYCERVQSLARDVLEEWRSIERHGLQAGAVYQNDYMTFLKGNCGAAVTLRVKQGDSFELWIEHLYFTSGGGSDAHLAIQERAKSIEDSVKHIREELRSLRHERCLGKLREACEVIAEDIADVPLEIEKQNLAVGLVDLLMHRALGEPDCCKTVVDIAYTLPTKPGPVRDFFARCKQEFEPRLEALKKHGHVDREDMLAWTKLCVHCGLRWRWSESFQIIGTLQDFLDAGSPAGVLGDLSVECACEVLKIAFPRLLCHADVLRGARARLEGVLQRETSCERVKSCARYAIDGIDLWMEEPPPSSASDPEARSRERRGQFAKARKLLRKCADLGVCADVKAEWKDHVKASEDPVREAHRLVQLAKNLVRQGYIEPPASPAPEVAAAPTWAWQEQPRQPAPWIEEFKAPASPVPEVAAAPTWAWHQPPRQPATWIEAPAQGKWMAPAQGKWMAPAQAKWMAPAQGKWMAPAQAKWMAPLPTAEAWWSVEVGQWSQDWAAYWQGHQPAVAAASPKSLWAHRPRGCERPGGRW